MDHQRHLGLFGATALGVGASVGGGILALAGVAFATTGPSAIVAFGLNGAVAFLTATSLARLARRFTDSGSFYLYARKLLSIEVAFVVGWVVWFASILAGVLYALGFAAFAPEGLGRGLETLGRSGEWTQANVPGTGRASDHGGCRDKCGCRRSRSDGPVRPAVVTMTTTLDPATFASV